MKKAKIDNTIYDVISMEDFKTNRKIYERSAGPIAIEKENGILYPIRTPSDTRCGFYPKSDKNSADFFIEPDEGQTELFTASATIIDFTAAKNLREVIEAQDKLNRAERSILTTADNITVPEVTDTDTPFMKAIKTTILQKRVDLDKYAHRFGNNYPNDKRLLRKNDMTLQKGITYAECLDFDMYLIITDAGADVPNPVGDPIVVRLTGDRSGFTEDFKGAIPEITDMVSDTPVQMPLQPAAFGLPVFSPAAMMQPLQIAQRIQPIGQPQQPRPYTPYPTAPAAYYNVPMPQPTPPQQLFGSDQYDQISMTPEKKRR